MSQELPDPDPSLRRAETPLYGSDDVPLEPEAWWQRALHHILRPWHLFRIWGLTRRIRRQRRELAKYVRRSAYEIAAWKQDIRFIAVQREYHLRRALLRPPARFPTDFKVVPLSEPGSQNGSSSSQGSSRC